uniref:Uncharacterized protein n=1 Tax=Lepeophtheirus salmonis TaxID=72036 RepID=A0A0K2U1W5_LEPSM
MKQSSFIVYMKLFFRARCRFLQHYGTRTQLFIPFNEFNLLIQ